MSNDDELWKSWMRLCVDPRTAGDLVEKAAYWESINTPNDYKIRLAVSKHGATSGDLLAKLLMIKYLPIQIAVAGHNNLSEKTAIKILRTQVRDLRRALAGNPKIPYYVMERLARDFDDVRMRLAKNPSIPLKLMSGFASEPDIHMRLALASNPSLHFSILESLSKDKAVEVRLAIVKHPRIPIGGLCEMARDKSNKVREAVFSRGMDDFAQEIELFHALSKGKSIVAQDARARIEVLLEAQNEDPPPAPHPDSNPFD